MTDIDSPGIRLPFRARFMYGFASTAGSALGQTWALWLLYFYTPPSDASNAPRIDDLGGLDARVLLGLTLTLARLIEALDDPVIAYATDRTVSRWGRRLPYIVTCTPAWGLMFFLLFSPPIAAADNGNLAYLFGVAMLYYLFSNLSGAGMEALLPNLAKRHDDRLSIASWQLVFGGTGAVIGLSLSSLLVHAFGFQVMAAVVALTALVVRYSTTVVIWPWAKADKVPSKPGLRLAVMETFSNRHFLAFLPSFGLFQASVQMLIALLPFYVDAILFDESAFGFTGADDTGAFTFMLTVAVMLGILAGMPLYQRLARRRGKARAYRIAMVTAAVWFPVLGFAGLAPGVSALAQALLVVFVAGMTTTGVYLFPNILTADITDDDAVRTGTRREAMFYGAQNMVEKAATAVSPLLFALVLLAGDSEDDPLGVRLVGPVAAILVFTAFASFRRYSLEPEAERRPASHVRY